MEVNKKVIWITGASSGIGRALAKVYAQQGATVVLSARRQQQLEDVKAELVNASQHVVVAFDVSDEKQVNLAVEKVIAQCKRIDVLINNAGLSQRALIAETTMETERRIMEVDYFSQVYLTKQVLPHLLAQKSGQIAFVSSIAGLLGTQYRASYSAAKAAIHMWANSLRAEVAKSGIDVAVIFPGFVKTDVSINALNGKGEAQGFDNEATANGLEVDDFAEQVIEALSKKQEYIVVGGFKEKLGVAVSRISPKVLYKMIRRMKVK